MGQSSKPNQSGSQSNEEQMDTGPTVDRRKVLTALGAMSTVGLAGCGQSGDGGGDGTPGGGGDGTPGDGGDGTPGDGGDGTPGDGGDGTPGGGGDGTPGGDQELGERVPTLTFRYFANLGTTTNISETALPIIKNNLDEIGIDVKIEGLDVIKVFNDVVEDRRTFDVVYWAHSQPLSRIDPQDLTMRWTANWAGGDGKGNTSNYADCKYTTLAHKQATAGSVGERRDLVHNAHSHMSDDVAHIQLHEQARMSAVRNDEVEINNVGQGGFKRLNPAVWVNSKPKNGDTIVSSTRQELVDTRNFFSLSEHATIGAWATLMHSPLQQYDENFELEKILAESIEVENNAQRVVVVLRDDATFWNGDPVTSEDVKFTFEELVTEEQYPQTTPVPFDSINTQDEKTIEFNFTEPFLPFLSQTIPKWGVVHKKSWVDAGVLDNPTTDIPDIVGSGPFKIVNFEKGESIHLRGYKDHATYSVDHDVIFQAFKGLNPRIQGFKANEIQVIPQAGPPASKQLKDELPDKTTITRQAGFTSHALYPAFPSVPWRFRPFRKAVGAPINREKLVNIAMKGFSEEVMHACALGPAHPWRPPNEELYKYTDDKTGNPEKARQILKDAGWGWDDQGRLHYPPDADLTPLWPKGDHPGVNQKDDKYPGSFPCVTNGNGGKYIPPGKR